MFTVSFLSFTPPKFSHHTLTLPVGSIHSTHQTIPLGPWDPSWPGCWGGGHWLSACNELLRDSVRFHHSRNCSRGAPDPMKTKVNIRNQYRGCLAPPPSQITAIFIYHYNWLCIIALMRNTWRNLSEVFLFFLPSCSTNLRLPTSI